MSPLIRTRVEADVGWLTLARPAKRNALTETMVDEAARAIDDFIDKDVSIVIVEAEGTIFCAGADIAEARSNLAAPSFERLLAALTHPAIFTIAAIEGPALGAGVAMAAACPIVVCTSEVWFSLPEHALGLFPSLVVAYIEEVLGPRRSLQMGLRGDRLTAQTALEHGLVNEVVQPEELEEAVQRWIEVLRRDPRVTRDAALGWRARFETESFRARRRVLGEIITA